MPIDISDDLSRFSDELVRSGNGPGGDYYDVVINEPLPPPIPFLAFNQASLKHGKPRLKWKQEDDGPGLRTGSEIPHILDFSPEIAEASLRDFSWTDIEDFTSFAPKDAVYHGQDVINIITSLANSDYSNTKCRPTQKLLRSRSCRFPIFRSVGGCLCG